MTKCKQLILEGMSGSGEEGGGGGGRGVGSGVVRDLRQPIKLGRGATSHLAGDSLCWLVTSTPSLLD